MQVEELKERARQRARALGEPTLDAEEGLRTDAMRLFARVPEPPVYRRRDDPARRLASELLLEVEPLLARAYQVQSVTVLPWRQALEEHAEGLCLVADGRVEAADEVWHRALQSERQATAARRLWTRTDEAKVPVYSKPTGESRYDARPEASMQVKLACPTCRTVSDYSFSPSHAMHRFTCGQCKSAFTAYFGEVRTVEIRTTGHQRRYRFRIEELGGSATRIDVDDQSAAELQCARRDLLAFIYAPETVLRGVLNLNSSRVLWLAPAGSCFVATLAFGEGAPQLEVLRRFRDQHLASSAMGRAFICWYYRHGPALAEVVRRVPGGRAIVRRALARVVKALEAS